MTKKYVFRKGLVIGIIILFVGASVAPCINGTISKMSGSELNKKTLNQELPSTEQIPNSLLATGDENSSSLAFHTFDETGEKQQNVVLSKDDADKIIDILEEMKYKIVYEPRSEETQALKNEFVDLLDAYGLIPAGLSKSYVLSLLNPSWLNNKQKTTEARTRTLLLKSFTSRITEKIAYLQQIFKNRFGITILKNFDKNTMITPSYADTATATFCSISSGGNGATLPLFLLPRPRGIAIWTASLAATLVGELLTGKGFTAGGAQTGTALGFMGLGLTYAFPGYTMYGFVGYAAFTSVSADDIEYYEPPNQAPVISGENPPSGSENIPLSTSKLSFRISDADEDLMDYTVTTDPDVGSGSGNFKKDGVYSVPISGLESSIFYRWTVEVTDDKDTTSKDFVFATESIPFDPFNEGWLYRKQITIDHTKVDGNLDDFPVLVSTVDSDLRDKAKFDGDDILFMDDVGVANKLYHEIEYYEGNNGELMAWVRIPDLDDSSDTVLYMYYGNPSCVNQQCPEWVWDSEYQAVWHICEDGLGKRFDSTFNNNDGTPYNYEGNEAITGVIDGADDFDGSNDHIRTGVSFDYNYRTVSFWFNTDTIPLSDVDMILSQNSDELIYGCFIAYLLNGEIVCFAGGNIDTGFHNDVQTETWYMVHMIRDGSQLRYYINGDYKHTSTSDSQGSTSNANRNLVIGADRVHNRPFDGILDEIRISNTARSEDWISTEYNNQHDPTGFLSFGPEETGP